MYLFYVFPKNWAQSGRNFLPEGTGIKGEERHFRGGGRGGRGGGGAFLGKELLLDKMLRFQVCTV